MPGGATRNGTVHRRNGRAQGVYQAMFPEIRVFGHPLFFDIQNGAGDMPLIEPRFEIEAGGKELPGNGSEVNSMIDGAFEGQGMAALTQEERTDDDAIF